MSLTSATPFRRDVLVFDECDHKGNRDCDVVIAMMNTWKISAFVAVWVSLVGPAGFAQDMILGDAQSPWVNDTASRVFGADVSKTGLSDLNNTPSGIGMFAVADIIKLAPPLGFLAAPYGILDHKHVAKINKDTSLLTEMSAPLASFDLEVIGVVYLGHRMMIAEHGNWGEPPIKPAMIYQKPIAVINDAANMYGVRDLGAVPVPLLADQFDKALEFEAVEFGEQWSMGTWPSRCVSVAMTGHQIELGLLLVKRDWWRGLSQVDQQGIRTKTMTDIESITQAILDQEADLLADHLAKGCDQIAVDVAAFKNQTRLTISTSAKPARWLSGVYQAMLALGG